MALNFSTPSSDVSMMARFFSAAYFSPSGLNFEHWTDDQFEGALAALCTENLIRIDDVTESLKLAE
jgi:peptide/nickel transport system substrate-binding protein